MGRNRVRLAAAVVVAVWAGCVGAQAAFASSAEDEAEKLIHHGVELRRARDDEAAAREFQKAYKLVPSPRAAAQLGLAKQALGLWEEAESYVGEALRAVNKDAWVAKNRARLDEALGTIQNHLGRIEVFGDPEGAEVALNGKRAGKLPLPGAIRVSAGAVDIDVRAPGYTPTQRTVTVVGGQYQRVVIHLPKVEAVRADLATPLATGAEPTGGLRAMGANGGAGSPVEQTTSAAAEADATVSRTAPPPSDTGEAGPSRTRVVLKWTAASLAVSGLVTGAVATALHSSKVDEFDGHPCRNRNGAGVLPDGTPDVACQSMLDSFKTDQKIAVVGFVAAGAFAATWLALMWTEPAQPSGSSVSLARRTVCAPALSGTGLDVGLSCAARF